MDLVPRVQHTVYHFLMCSRHLAYSLELQTLELEGQWSENHYWFISKNDTVMSKYAKHVYANISNNITELFETHNIFVNIIWKTYKLLN